MINAVLVFNGNGQPRLTKFYTQIVSFDFLLSLSNPIQFNSRREGDMMINEMIEGDERRDETRLKTNPSYVRIPKPNNP